MIFGGVDRNGIKISEKKKIERKQQMRRLNRITSEWQTKKKTNDNSDGNSPKQ